MHKTIAVVALVFFLVLVVAVVGRERVLSLTFGPVEIIDTDFPELVLGPNPNQYLVCPVNYCTAKAHLDSPVFNVSSDILQQRWLNLMEQQPRIETVVKNDEKLQHEFIQRSLLMRYPDSITVRFISLNENRSTLAIYSRSHFGKSDFGVNKDRITTWLFALESQ